MNKVSKQISNVVDLEEYKNYKKLLKEAGLELKKYKVYLNSSDSSDFPETFN